jgi:U4/U6 small nuclear ribonucleoprotein PRP3
MARRFCELKKPLIRTIIIGAAGKGASVRVLESQLSKIFSNQKDLNMFLRKYESAINEFTSEDFFPSVESIRREKTDANFRRQARPTPVHTETGADVRHRAGNELHVAANSHDRSSRMVLPKSFLSSAQISLRKADEKIKPLVLNEKGERLDDDGQIIMAPIPSKQGKVAPTPVDRRIVAASKPTSREFSFLAAGDITNRVEAIRKKAAIDRKVATGTPLFDVIASQRDVEIPEIDWWDLPFVQLDEHQIPISVDGKWIPNYDSVDDTFHNAAPVPVHHHKSKELPTILTQQEKKRLKHIRKLEKRNEERLMIKLNLKEKEVPKLKPGQMITLGGTNSALAPTEVEMSVKKAREDRIRRHEEANEARKLTDSERRQKKVKMRRADSENNVSLYVFAVRVLESALNLATLIRMAQKWFMTGGVFKVKFPAMTFVLIEAGEKGGTKFCRLMERIKWQEDGDENRADLVFQGPVTKRSFFNFKRYVFDVGTQCRGFCEKYGSSGAFDAAARYFEI